MTGLRTIPGPDPGACPLCGKWRKAGMLHTCEPRKPQRFGIPLVKGPTTYTTACDCDSQIPGYAASMPDRNTGVAPRSTLYDPRAAAAADG